MKRQVVEEAGAGPARERAEDPGARRPQVLEARRTAANPAYEKIRRDRDRVPAGLAAVLERVEAHLFDEDLSIDAQEVSEEHLGATLEYYFRTLQVETAVRMPRILMLDYELDVSIEELAAAVGLPDVTGFRYWHVEVTGILPEVFEARNIAAKPIYEEIRKDIERSGSKKLSKALVYIEENLFDKRLSVGAALESAEASESVGGTTASNNLGMTLKYYYRTAQIKTAVRMREVLLRDYSSLAVPTGEIATAVGFNCRRTFFRQYHRITDSQPEIFLRSETLEIGFNYFTHNRGRRSKLSPDDAEKLLKGIPPAPVATADLRTATTEPLQRICRDAEQVPSELCRRLLNEFRKSLLKPLNIGSALALAEIAKTDAQKEFTFYLGEKPKSYLEKRLVEAALFYVGETSLKISEIAELIGVSVIKTFNNMFKRRTGETPTDIRDLTEDINDFVEFKVFLRFGCGKATAAEDKRVGDLLRRLAPESSLDEVLIVDGADLIKQKYTRLEEGFAENTIWPALRDLSFEEAMKKVVSYRFLNAPTALFDVLCKKSLSECRGDRPQGVRFTELARMSLKANAERLGDRFSEKSALAWAWMGNAKRLAFDFPGSSVAFREAFQELRRWENFRETVTVAIIYDLLASLRLAQRLYSESVDLITQSLNIFERVGDKRRQIRALQKLAVAQAYSGDPKTAATILERALALGPVDEETDFSLNLSMANAWERSGEYRRAATEYQKVQPKKIAMVDSLWQYQATWTEGAILHGLGEHEIAKDRYDEARNGFLSLNDTLNGALVSLDLLVLLSDLGRSSSELVNIASKIVHVFQGLRLYPETNAALRLLSKSTLEVNVSSKVLREFRNSTRRDPLISMQLQAEPGRPEERPWLQGRQFIR